MDSHAPATRSNTAPPRKPDVALDPLEYLRLTSINADGRADAKASRAGHYRRDNEQEMDAFENTESVPFSRRRKRREKRRQEMEHRNATEVKDIEEGKGEREKVYRNADPGVFGRSLNLDFVHDQLNGAAQRRQAEELKARVASLEERIAVREEREGGNRSKNDPGSNGKAVHLRPTHSTEGHADNQSAATFTSGSVALQKHALKKLKSKDRRAARERRTHGSSGPAGGPSKDTLSRRDQTAPRQRPRKVQNGKPRRHQAQSRAGETSLGTGEHDKGEMKGQGLATAEKERKDGPKSPTARNRSAALFPPTMARGRTLHSLPPRPFWNCFGGDFHGESHQ